MTRWHLVVWVAATALTWLITDHYHPWPSFHAEAIAVLGGASLVVYAVWRGRTLWRPMPLLLLLLAAVPLLQWAAGLVVYSGDALLASAYVAGAALCWWAGDAADPALRRRLLETFVGTFFTLGVVCTGIALYQQFDIGFLGIWGSRPDANGRSTAGIGQANHLASMLCFSLASLVLMRAWRIVGAPVAVAAAAFILLGLALTQSRVPWVATVIIVAWMAVRPRQLAHPLETSRAVALALAGWYAVAFWLAQAHQAVSVLGANAGLLQSNRFSAGSRPTIWAQWIETLSQSPWVGIGWLQGHSALLLGSTTHPGYEYSAYAHNVALDILAWNGVPLGGLLLLLLTAWYFRAGWRGEGAEHWLRLAIITVFAVHALLEYPHAYVYFLVPVCMLAGQTDAATGTVQTSAPRTWHLPRTALATVASAVLIVYALAAHDYVKIEADTRELRAQKINLGGHRTSEPPTDILVLDQLLAFVRAGRIEPRRNMPAAQLDDLLTVTQRYPTLYFLQQSAVALVLNGRDDEALRHVRWIASIHGRAGLASVLTALEAREAERPAGLRPHLELWRREVPPA